MQTENIREGNRIIAEFMGFDWQSAKKFETKYDESYSQMHGDKEVEVPLTLDDLQYHEDWSELMEVVDKIESLHSLRRGDYINVRISQGYVEIEGVPGQRILKNTSIEGSKIKALWLALIQFIQWFNQNK